MRIIILASTLTLLLAAGPGRAQCTSFGVPAIPDTVVVLGEIPEEGVSHRFYYPAINEGFQDETITFTLTHLSGPSPAAWNYQFCWDEVCRRMFPFESSFTIENVLESEAVRWYDVELIGRTFETGVVELTITREFCPETPIVQTLSLGLVDETSLEQPTALELQPAWPNPFNPLAHLPFVLERAGEVRVDVHDLAGRRVATPLWTLLPAGRHEALFDGAGLPSGRYTYTVRMEGQAFSAPLTLIK
jgi:hypothetical protein